LRRFITITVLFCVFIGLGIGWRWHAYVTNTDSPFEEVGIELNSLMPAPIRDWGCGRLKQTFGTKTLPPYGCSAADGKAWR